MNRHVSEARLVDALDGQASDADAEHLAVCEACQVRLEVAAQGLALAQAAAIPEPSPLYWRVFARQLDERLRAQGRPSWRPWLTPLLAAAAVALAFVSLLPEAPRAPTGVPAEAVLWQALPPLEQDPGAPVFEALGATVEEAYLLAGCELDECLADLSEAERRDLARLLREELAGRKS